MRVNRKKLNNLIGFFSEKELEELGILEQETSLMSGILNSEQEKKLATYCISHNISKSELLRQQLEFELEEKNVSELIKFAKNEKRYRRSEDTKTITFLVPIKQKTKIQLFVREYKESLDMTETFLVQLVVSLFLKKLEKEVEV